MKGTMETEQVIHGTWKNGDPVDLTLSRANLEIGMTRARLLLEAQQANESKIDRHLLRFLYADVMAAMVNACSKDEASDGSITYDLPMSFEMFIDLSDTTGAELERVVYQLNAHWVPVPSGELSSPKE